MTRTWKNFKIVEDDQYKIYMYLAIVHGLDVPIMEALGCTVLFDMRDVVDDLTLFICRQWPMPYPKRLRTSKQ